ncbi:hypothetical protein THTE_3642 [Thermogutta terrifontis]|jgi:hypothetical protein|uniref:Uncharacterized protein n=1 Tax=Thermogutta terrifontis TaxID=1331910 RepID=A0A286RJU8_9BACT|nr:hypothetical protein THTE_3642 [Thermogutta terrifontis]
METRQEKLTGSGYARKESEKLAFRKREGIAKMDGCMV